MDVSHRTKQMIRYAAARSRCEICHNTEFAIRDEPVVLAGLDYAAVFCTRCGRLGLHDLRVLQRQSEGAPVDTVEADPQPRRRAPR